MTKDILTVILISSFLFATGCANVREEIAISTDQDNAPDPFGGQSGDIPERTGLIEKKTGKKLEKSFGF